MSTSKAKSKMIFEREFEATREIVWAVLVELEDDYKFPLDTTIDSSTEWISDEPIKFVNSDNEILIEGDIIDIDEQSRVEFTFQFTDKAGSDLASDAPSRVVWQLEPEDDDTSFSITHFVDKDSPTGRIVDDSWDALLDELESQIEDYSSLREDDDESFTLDEDDDQELDDE